MNTKPSPARHLLLNIEPFEERGFVAWLTGFSPENRIQRIRGERWYLRYPTLNPFLRRFPPQNGTVAGGRG
jgi:hypothetical protein